MDKILIDNQSICSVALEYILLSRGMLRSWICSYKKHGYFTESKILSSFTVYKPTQKTAKKGFFCVGLYTIFIIFLPLITNFLNI